MQRIIQINIVGRVIPIEEDAYQVLKKYIDSLERQFAGEQGNDEILQGIENRIAELFTARLNGGAPAIDKADVQKVMDTLGAASDLHEAKENNTSNTNFSHSRQSSYVPPVMPNEANTRRLYRNTNDKMIGGVCSGIAMYFDIDPVIVRLTFAVLFLTAGIGLLAYILAWIIIPAAKTPYDMYSMTGGSPMDFHTMQKNMAEELQDLKKRGEQMSRDLQDFFSKKK
ncbi:MAG: PspC domain-containing protein [Bacteroidetes bacterium]|nr:PspC domain-containing protein [Bacteroidota bacterium]